MDGKDFYYETRTKVNVFLQEQRQITLHQFLLPFMASGETASGVSGDRVTVQRFKQLGSMLYAQLERT